MPSSLAVVVLGVMTIACSTASELPDAKPGEDFPLMTGDGAWCWFSDPRAVYFEGQYRRTYAGWVDSTGSIIVAQYDHDSGEITTHNLHTNLQVDDHNNPTFFVADDGRLTVYYTMHSRSTPIFQVRSVYPEDITTWEEARLLALNDTVAYKGMNNTYTYTNIVQLSEENDKQFLFWRGSDFKPNVSVSHDDGQTWEAGRILVLPERIYGNRRPYLKVSSDNKRDIHFAFTDGHPRVEPSNSIYYAHYRDGALERANGDKIMDWSDLPMNPDQADKVYDAAETGAKAWIWDVACDPQGRPVVVYATFPTDSTHVYHYAIHDGDRWNNYRLTDAGSWFPHTAPGMTEGEPNYSGGLVLDHEDPRVVFLSIERDGVFEIERWETPDAGESWEIHPITQNSARDNVRPFVVRNHKDDGPVVMWMNLHRYTHYTDYRAGIPFATSGGRVARLQNR